MKNFFDKLRLIYMPFVLIAIGFILTYTFLHWLLFIKVGISLNFLMITDSMNENKLFYEEFIKCYLLPFGLALISVVIWLLPRIELLHFETDSPRRYIQMLRQSETEHCHNLYPSLAWIAIAIPTIIAQEYLVTVTGELTQLDNISQILQHDKTKFFWIFGSLGIGFLVFFVFLLLPKIQERELEKFERRKATKDTDLKDWQETRNDAGFLRARRGGADYRYREEIATALDHLETARKDLEWLEKTTRENGIVLPSSNSDVKRELEDTLEEMKKIASRNGIVPSVPNRIYHTGLVLVMIFMTAIFFAYTEKIFAAFMLWLWGGLVVSVLLFLLGIFLKRKS